MVVVVVVSLQEVKSGAASSHHPSGGRGQKEVFMQTFNQRKDLWYDRQGLSKESYDRHKNHRQRNAALCHLADCDASATATVPRSSLPLANRVASRPSRSDTALPIIRYKNRTRWTTSLSTHFLQILVVLMAAACPTARALTGSIYRHPARFQTWIGRNFHATTTLHLNRFLFDPNELDASLTAEQPSVTVAKDDYRTIHAAKILGLHNGDTVRAGVVRDAVEPTDGSSPYAGLVTDEATVQWVPEGRVKKAEPLGNGNPPGSLRITLHNLIPPPLVPERPLVSLILALPRPIQLNRMLPMITQMGVDHLVLTQAQKVPRDYFGSHLFRDPQRLRERFIEGLCQAGVDVRLPRVTVVKNLRHFLHNDLERCFPSGSYARVIAHPERVGRFTVEPVVGSFVENMKFPCHSPRRVVLAVGPEGGWAEPDELNLLTQDYGFQTVTLGPRVLRSDVAVIALMALAHEACRVASTEQDST